MKKSDLLKRLKVEADERTPDPFDSIVSAAKEQGIVKPASAAKMGAAHASGMGGSAKIIIGSLIAALAVTAAVSGTVGASLAVNYAQQQSGPPTTQQPEEPNPPVQLIETQGLEYEKIDGGYAVTGIGTATDTKIVIPKKYNNEPVVRINESAFSGNENIISVTVQENIERIEGWSFYNCTALEEIVLPDTAISIGESAFLSSKYQKDKSNWEGNALYIGKHLIDTASSKELTVKTGTLTVAENALLGSNDDFSCVITFNKELLLIENSHRSPANGMSYKVEEGNVRYKIINDCLVDAPNKALILAGSQGVIPDDGSVTQISEYAFFGYSGLVTIPACIDSIAKRAFYHSNLYDLIFEGNISKIEEETFVEVYVKSFTVPSYIKEISTNAFNRCQFNTLIIEEGVEIIAEKAFNGGMIDNLYLPIDISLNSLSFFNIGKTSQNTSSNIEIYYAGTEIAYWNFIKNNDWFSKADYQPQTSYSINYSGKLSDYDLEKINYALNFEFDYNLNDEGERQIKIYFSSSLIQMEDTIDGNGYFYGGDWELQRVSDTQLKLVMCNIERLDIVDGELDDSSTVQIEDSIVFDVYQSINGYYTETYLKCESDIFKDLIFLCSVSV